MYTVLALVWLVISRARAATVAATNDDTFDMIELAVARWFSSIFLYSFSFMCVPFRARLNNWPCAIYTPIDTFSLALQPKANEMMTSFLLLLSVSFQSQWIYDILYELQHTQHWDITCTLHASISISYEQHAACCQPTSTKWTSVKAKFLRT